VDSSPPSFGKKEGREGKRGRGKRKRVYTTSNPFRHVYHLVSLQSGRGKTKGGKEKKGEREKKKEFMNAHFFIDMIDIHIIVLAG